VDIGSGAYPEGTRVALRSEMVQEVTGTVITFYGFIPCPPGYFCGDGSTIVAVDVDMAPLGRVPDLWSTIDLYGAVHGGTSLVPSDYVVVTG
jgi:hypothetical protein